MPEDLALRETVRTDLRSMLSSTSDMEEYLQSSVESIGRLIGLDCSYTLSTVLYDAPFSVATTDRNAWEADQVEFDVAEGPCFELLRKDEVFGGIDLQTERRWPVWAAVATVLGFRSAAAVGTELASGEKLVLNCYSDGEAFLDQTAVGRADQFLHELAFTIPLALRLVAQSTEIAQLQEALASRSTIDQALGVLMTQNRCTRDQAFAVLRRASQNRNVKLRDVAASVIERFTSHPPQQPPAFRPPSARR
jgi:ANTAR domain-containing protein